MEYEHLRSMGSKAKQINCFYDLWTLKASYIKFIGRGLSIPNPKSIGLFDTIHRSDSVYLINKGIVFVVFFTVLGATRGFELECGPIYWGLIGMISGFILGILIDLFLHRGRKVSGSTKGKASEVLALGVLNHIYYNSKCEKLFTLLQYAALIAK